MRSVPSPLLIISRGVRPPSDGFFFSIQTSASFGLKPKLERSLLTSLSWGVSGVPRSTAFRLPEVVEDCVSEICDVLVMPGCMRSE